RPVLAVASTYSRDVAEAVAIDRLRVSRGGRDVLPDVTLGVRSGTVTGLLGPSGSGKTTLMRAIVGVQVVAAGRLEVLWQPAGRPRSGSAPRPLGRLPRPGRRRRDPARVEPRDRRGQALRRARPPARRHDRCLGAARRTPRADRRARSRAGVPLAGGGHVTPRVTL